MSRETMRAVALGLADGQIEQADWHLEAHAQGGRLRLNGPAGGAGQYRTNSHLITALQHMRSAAKWLEAAV